jgi:phenylpropionate dioxygenase-like ring-hydroxylating dioxygenase large terminal subunit
MFGRIGGRMMKTIDRIETKSPVSNAPHHDWDFLVQEDRVHSQLYTSPDIFDAEMRYIFGGTWVYLAHESQVPNANDFITAKLGRRPLIITRDAEGAIRALYNRCTHRGTTLCRLEKGNKLTFQCPYHGWNFLNNGKLRGVPWADGYAGNLTKDPKYNLAQVPRVESYRGFVFGTLNMSAAPLNEHLGPIKKPIDEWLDRNPGGKVIVCEANRIKYKGNWKLAYDNSGDGYHVLYSHRSLLEMENRFVDEQAQKGMSYYKTAPDEQPMYIQYMGNGHHFKDKRPNLQKRPGGLWAIESLHPGMEQVAEKLHDRFGTKADSLLDLAGSEPVNINVFPNLSLLGNHIQVFQPISVDETDAIWYGTKIEDVEGTIGDEVLNDINTLRMRTQEGFPNFGEVDDVTNFEQIQRGLRCEEDEWIYMNRGLGIPGRIHQQTDGTIKGPATDELFMREYIKEWKRLMSLQPTLSVKREPQT